jgi:hypothetical protein
MNSQYGGSCNQSSDTRQWSDDPRLGTIKLAEYRCYDELRMKLVSALEYGAHGFAFA